jgi:hypothetical protein
VTFASSSEVLNWRSSSRLQRVPRERLVETLQPLPQEGGDTGKIVGTLLREMLLPKEVTPVERPAGRGDEPTAPEAPG